MDKSGLAGMTAADVIRQAIIMSRKTQEEIEAEAGLRPGALDQFSARRDPHWPNLLNIPSLCQAMGNDMLIRWQATQLEAKCLQHATRNMTNEEILREVVTAAREFGDVARAAEKSLADNNMTRAEALAIRREAMEVVARMFSLINGVAARV